MMNIKQIADDIVSIPADIRDLRVDSALDNVVEYSLSETSAVSVALAEKNDIQWVSVLKTGLTDADQADLESVDMRDLEALLRMSYDSHLCGNMFGAITVDDRYSVTKAYAEPCLSASMVEQDLTLMSAVLDNICGLYKVESLDTYHPDQHWVQV